MNIIKSIRIMRSLASGKNPYTHKKLPDRSPYQESDTIRALYQAIEALEIMQKSKKQKDSPLNAGMSWTKKEERLMLEEYDLGLSIKRIAKMHQRSEGGIRARLEKNGKLIPSVKEYIV